MKKYVVALALSALVAAPAFAAEMDFAKVDADGNGAVTLESDHNRWEWTEEQFAAADKNSDGALDAEEFQAASAM
ncbi:MAG: hypothetical protein R3D34_14860 [Nitratireductor sp.]